MVRRPLRRMARASLSILLSSVNSIFQNSASLRMSITRFVSSYRIQGTSNGVKFINVRGPGLPTFSFNGSSICSPFLRVNCGDEEKRLAGPWSLVELVIEVLSTGERQYETSMYYPLLCTFRRVNCVFQVMGFHYRYRSISTFTSTRIVPFFGLDICLRQYIHFFP